MPRDVHFFVSDSPETRLGRLVLATEHVEDPATMPTQMRTVSGYLLVVLVDGQEIYRHTDGLEHLMTPGTIVVTHPNQPHAYETVPGHPCVPLFAIFSGPIFDTLATAGVLPNDGPHIPHPAPSPDSLRTILKAAPTSQQAAEHQLLALADWLVDAAPPPDSPPLSPMVATAVERLVENLGADVDVHAIAEELGVAYNTFRRHFTTEVGQPPQAFRNTRRLQAAANLLRLTDMPVRTIAHTLGYADVFHFSRRFRAHFGTPPSTYRTAERRGTDA